MSLATLLTAVAVWAAAETVSVDSAQAIAERVLSFSRPAGSKALVRGAKPQVQRLEVQSLTMDDTEHPLFYVFTRAGGKGFAIVADDDTMTPLIGYSLDGTFSADSLPCALVTMLQRLAASRTPSRKVGPLEPGNVLVEPYLKTTWNQYAPYNWLAPAYNEDGRINHHPTGCLPTAAAQVMNYYQWPATSYYRRYDWDHMKNSYNSYTHTEGMAVATLMRDLGRMMGSRYAKDGTSTSANSYTTIPGYKCTPLTDVESCKKYIYKGPLNICTGNGFIHAVVFDGLDDHNYYHVNWGWGGSCDGYYNMTDMAITYGGNEVHPAITSWSYFLEPDTEAAPVTLVAAGGVTVDRSRAAVGDEVKVTMHCVKQLSGKPFNGYIGVCPISGKETDAGGYYSFTRSTNGKKGFAKDNPFHDCRVHWDSSHDGEDVTITLTMRDLGNDGDYHLAPISCDESEGNGDDSNDYHQWVQVADGVTADDVPFSWHSQTAIFSNQASEDYDVKVNLITASTYRQGGESQIVARVTNGGTTDFNGTLTLTLTPTTGKGSIKTVEMDFHAAAGQTQYDLLTMRLNFTGTYRITHYELSRINLAGVKTTYDDAEYDGAPFEVLPPSTDVDDSHLNSSYGISSENTYTGEDKDVMWVYFKEYDGHVNTDKVDVEFIVIPFEGGSPQSVGRFDGVKVQPQSEENTNFNYFNLATRRLKPGTYVVVGLVQIGNATQLIGRIDDFNKRTRKDYEYSKVILNVLDPGIEIPSLKILSYKPLGTCYKGQYNTVALQVENTGDVDFVGKASTKWRYSEQDTHMWVDGTFCVKAREKGTVFLKFSKYNNNGTRGNDPLSYTLNSSEVGSFAVPFDGNRTVTLDFEEMPTNNTTNYGYTLFYYRKSNSQGGTAYSNSSATIKRTIYRDDKVVLNLPDVVISSRGYFHPSISELSALPQGVYWMKAEFISSTTNSPKNTYICPIYIIDGEPLAAVDEVKFVQSHDLTMNSDLPFLVKIINLSDEDIIVPGSYTLYKISKEGQYTYWYTAMSPQPFTVSVPAGKRWTLPLTAKITVEEHRNNGQFRAEVSVNRNGRTGMVDNITSYADIILPFKSTGVEEVAANALRVPVAYYDLLGRRLERPLHGGFNVILYDDGSVEKRYCP